MKKQKKTGKACQIKAVGSKRLSNGCVKDTVEDTKRIIDANLNRCREGLRVVEDSMRFVLDDEALYKKIRRIRHESDKILRKNYGDLISERDTLSDSGRQMPETSKKKLPEIIIANFKRVQEALRVLEEYSKTYMPKAAPEFKKQRYAAYNLEKTVFLKFRIFFNDKR